MSATRVPFRRSAGIRQCVYPARAHKRKPRLELANRGWLDSARSCFVLPGSGNGIAPLRTVERGR